MRGELSELVELYAQVFGVMPSDETRETLLALEVQCELGKDDIMAPVVVAQMRALDNMHGLVASFEQTIHKNQLNQARRDQLFREMIAKLEQLSAPGQKRKFWRRERERRTPGGYETGPVVLDVYQKDAPLLSYLGQAFALKNGVLERDERIAAARRSLLYLVPCLAAVAMLGALVGHYFLNG